MQSEAGAAAALESFDSAVLTALKKAAQALSAYGSEVDHHAALVAAQESRLRQKEMPTSLA